MVTLLVLSEIHFRITSVKLPVTSTTSLNSMLTKLSSELVRVGLCLFDIGDCNIKLHCQCSRFLVYQLL